MYLCVSEDPVSFDLSDLMFNAEYETADTYPYSLTGRYIFIKSTVSDFASKYASLWQALSKTFYLLDNLFVLNDCATVNQMYEYFSSIIVSDSTETYTSEQAAACGTSELH